MYIYNYIYIMILFNNFSDLPCCFVSLSCTCTLSAGSAGFFHSPSCAIQNICQVKEDKEDLGTT